MTTDWINLAPWGEFPDPFEKRCDLIAQHVRESGWHGIEKWKGSYSFKALVDGHEKTVAKLVPQFENSTPIILVAFSPSVPESGDFARRFDWRGQGTIMHEPFCLSRIPDNWSVERVATIIGEFLNQVPPAGRGRVSL